MDEMPRRPFTNIYVKNFGEEMTDDMLKEMFENYGNIVAHKVVLRNDGKSRGYGFVSFEDPEAADRAVADLDGKEVFEGKVLCVRRTQKLSEMKQEMRLKLERLQKELMTSHERVVLDVKNLDDTIDDDRLLREFSPFGTVISVKVKLENGRSKGFGIVCFKSVEEASNAVKEMNGRVVGSKPLCVELAQPKDDLASQFMQFKAKMRLRRLEQTFQRSDQFVDSVQIDQMQPVSWPTEPITHLNAQAPGTGIPPLNRMPSRPIAGQQPGTQGQPANCNMPNPPQPMHVTDWAQVQQGQEPLTASMLASASPEEQKQMLGERLFPFVQCVFPDLAGKITGMLLELDNTELLHMLEHHESLKAKVIEAFKVLLCYLIKEDDEVKKR